MVYQLPRIRMELEGMKESIVHALGMHSQEIERHVEEELSKAIEAFDFEFIVRDAANDAVAKAVRQAIETYFSYGDGHKAIEEIVNDGLRRAVESLARKNHDT